MASERLPDEGPVRLGSVDLPAGKLVKGNIEGDHVAWATVDPVPRAGWAWAALSELHPRTGLVPILLDGLPGDSMRFDSPELAGLSHDRLRPRGQRGVLHSGRPARGRWARCRRPGEGDVARLGVDGR